MTVVLNEIFFSQKKKKREKKKAIKIKIKKDNREDTLVNDKTFRTSNIEETKFQGRERKGKGKKEKSLQRRSG